MIHRHYFFETIRPLFGKLAQSQVDGLTLFLNQHDSVKPRISDREFAYILATTFHETAKTFQPIAEFGKGKGKPYGVPDSQGRVYYGRGYVQLTWRENYERQDRKHGLDGALAHNPDFAMEPELALKIIWFGMIDGDFTGKKLADYFGPNRTDWVQARRIVNGTDRAELIAAYAVSFHNALGHV